jgi:valyl-tRNA synthetase
LDRREKSMSPTELPSRFIPAEVDARWQRAWKEHGSARAPVDPKGPVYSLVLPPPNVTGILTIGHMLGGTVMDTLVRWHRMRGDATLWVPGVDHAGVGTEVEVRKRLAKQGVRFESLTREQIIARVEAWKQEHEARILEQQSVAGFLLDASRYRYTMDPASVRATRHVFVQLYREGLIYRGERIVNWDPKLKTAVSDLEVVSTEEPAELLYIRYEWADGSPGGIVVATVRPETIFGDVAVAVHPKDERHAAAIGRRVRVPLTDRDVPVIADDLVDPAFGNGALKVTPGHDALDFQIGRKHPEIAKAPSVIDFDGRLTSDFVPERFRGEERFRARAAVAAELEARGLLDRKEPYVHAVGRSERSEAVIEPLLSTQWFVRMPALAPPAVADVQEGKVRLHPARWELTYFRWMETLEDWCISRQVTWGHPIPVLYCAQCHAEIVEEVDPDRCPKCGALDLRPDPDVLDTWFSSWLWPFSALGWPEPTAELRSYFPTSVLVTGRDIMFFWVARMMMASRHFTGQPPFSDVYFTGMLRDETGRRMSKHLGNSPDPLAVIREWGADALRFALLFPNPTDQDGPFKESNLEASRNFLTKVWNVSRLLLRHLPEGSEPSARPPVLGAEGSLEERWILSRWRSTQESVDAALGAFEFTKAAGALRDFLWHDVADRFVEMSKDALMGDRGEVAQRSARGTLHFVMDRTLRALHPMVPHVTEELWHALPHSGELLIDAPWPRPGEAPSDPGAEREMESILESVRVLRLLRSENDVPVKDTPAAWVRPSSPEHARILEMHAPLVVRLARTSSYGILGTVEPAPGSTVASVTPVGEIFLARPADAESADWESMLREKDKLVGLLDKAERRLADPGFRSRAPPNVIQESEAKAVDLKERIRRIDLHLDAAPAGTTEAS